MRWSKCRSEAEKRIALRRALDEEPSLTAAARALGINRQYLYELLPRYAPDWATSDTADAQDTTDRPDTTDSVGSVGDVGDTDSVGDVGSVGPTDSVSGNSADTTVGQTPSGSLTYGRRRPTLRNVETAGTVDMHRTAIDLPKSWLDWLEQEALRRKQSGQQQRLSKSPVVIEALELLRQRIEGERDK